MHPEHLVPDADLGARIGRAALQPAALPLPLRRHALRRLDLTGLSGWHSSRSSSISMALTARWVISCSKLAQGFPPRTMEVLHSDWEPTVWAQIRLAAQTRPPMITPRPDWTSTSPPQ